MTGNERPAAPPSRPPWSVDLLADLHAGVLDDADAAELRTRVQDDPEARAVFAALDATVADLGNLPPLTMPPDVVARLEAALDAEARTAFAEAPLAPVVGIAAARRRRAQRLGWGAGMLAAAAIGVAVVVVPSTGPGSPPQAAVPTMSSNPSGQPQLALRSDQLGGVVPDVLGARDYGPLDTPDRLASCLTANGLDGAAKPLGVRQLNLDGRPGVLIILPTGQLAHYRLLVVAPTCGPDSPGLISTTTIGG